ncbi:MAG TPA: methyltransferase domain-containing protein, partial [Candidatus Limnocylindrales bacterium]|nr:methyltransferase domain-containing protein [Candidatus Limnocylindrales bacterium]
WGPVIAPSARQLLDDLDAALPPEGRGATLLDLGTGTGVLAVEAARRWPALSIIAVDLSPGMLAAAAARAERELPGSATRFAWHEGTAARLPLPDVSVDVAVSSFVLQLVPDRPAALREIRRVLQPGGRLGFVTWATDRPDFAPEDAFDEAIYDAGIEEPEEPPDGRAGPMPSAAAAAAQLRRAGFRAVTARDATLERQWDAESYLAFKLAYEEEPLVRALDPATGQALEVAARRRLAALPSAAFRWVAPIVYAQGTRPDR